MVLSKNSKYKSASHQPPQRGGREKAAELTELDLILIVLLYGQTAIGLSTT